MEDVLPTDGKAAHAASTRSDVPLPRKTTRKRSWALPIGVLLLAIAAAAVVKTTLTFRRTDDVLQKHALIKSNLPGGEWVCRREQNGQPDEAFTLSVNPGVQVVTPSGAISGGTRLDSTTRAPSSSKQLYFGASDLHEDKVSLRWLAHWTDPAELRSVALREQRLLTMDPARYATDLSQQNYVTNLFRGITVFEKPIMEETITVDSISRNKFSGTTVTTTEDGKRKTTQPIECSRRTPINTPQPTQQVATAAPRRAPETLPASSGDDARSFVDEWFRTTSSAQRPEDVLRLYAPSVKYYDRGVVPRSYVRQDKQYYFNRWPMRQSRIASPVRVTELDPDHKLVSFTLWYRLEDGNRQMREGTTPVRLVLGKHDGRLLIDGEG